MAGGHLLALRAVEGIKELRAANVADEDLGGSGFYDWVALVLVVAHDALYGAEFEACGWEGHNAGGHYLGDGDAEGAFLLVVEKRVAVEPDGSVRYAAMTEAFTDGFGDADNDLACVSVALSGAGAVYTMVGRMYVKAPVISNMITTTETVMCIMPERAAAAPRKA